MNQTLKELIDASIIDGNITDEKLDYIFKKGKDLNVDEVEIKIILDSLLQKNKKNDSKESFKKASNEDQWNKFENFQKIEWILVGFSVLMIVSGFFPWIKSGSSSSSSLGYHSASSSLSLVGLMYTIPLGISGLIFILNKKLTNFRVFYGLFIVFVSFGLMSIYSNSISSRSEFLGVSARAYTEPGIGVIILLISGISYSLTSQINRLKKENLDKIKTILLHKYALTFYFLIFTIVPFYFDLSYDFKEKLFFALCFGLPPLLISRKLNLIQTKKIFYANLVYWIFYIISVNYSPLKLLFHTSIAFNIIKPYYLIYFSIISIIGILLDFDILNPDHLNNYKIKYSSLNQVKLTVIAFIAPLVLISGYSMMTYHLVTDEEFIDLTNANNEIVGDWYFLNTDSTDINTISISFSPTVKDDKGNVRMDYDLNVVTVENDFNLTNNQAQVTIEDNYKHKITYPFVFKNLLTINSFKNNELKGILISSNGKKITFTATKDYEFYQSLIRERGRTTEEGTSYESTESIDIAQSGSFEIGSDKAYLYSEPNFSTKQESYLISGDSGEYSDYQNGFIFINYTTSKGNKISGWIDVNDLVIEQ